MRANVKSHEKGIDYNSAGRSGNTRLVLRGEELRATAARPPRSPRRQLHRLGDSRRHRVVGAIHRPGTRNHHTRNTRPQPRLPRGGSARGGNEAAIRHNGLQLFPHPLGNGRGRQRNKRLLRQEKHLRPGIRPQGDSRMGSGPVGRPEMGATQGRGRVPRLSRAAARHADHSDSGGGLVVLRAACHGQSAPDCTPHAVHPRGESQEGETTLRRRPHQRNGLPAGTGGVRHHGGGDSRTGKPHRGAQKRHIAAYGALS